MRKWVLHKTVGLVYRRCGWAVVVDGLILWLQPRRSCGKGGELRFVLRICWNGWDGAVGTIAELIVRWECLDGLIFRKLFMCKLMRVQIIWSFVSYTISFSGDCARTVRYIGDTFAVLYVHWSSKNRSFTSKRKHGSGSVLYSTLCRHDIIPVNWACEDSPIHLK